MLASLVFPYQILHPCKQPVRRAHSRRYTVALQTMSLDPPRLAQIRRMEPTKRIASLPCKLPSQYRSTVIELGVHLGTYCSPVHSRLQVRNGRLSITDKRGRLLSDSHTFKVQHPMDSWTARHAVTALGRDIFRW